MKTSATRKREALQAVEAAGELVATKAAFYTCYALRRAGISSLRPKYCRRVLGFSASGLTVHLRLVELGLRPKREMASIPHDEDREHRLILLATFHTLIQSGDIKI
jgi:hypothetical protein